MSKVKRFKGVVMGLAFSAMMAFNAFAADDALLDLSTIKFDGIFTEVLAVVPYVLPVVISFIALRKGITFLKGMLKGA